MRRVPFHVIQAAKEFDPEAVKLVFRHFENFIVNRCRIDYTDKYGNMRSYADADLRYQAEIALFKAIAAFRFREPPDDFVC